MEKKPNITNVTVWFGNLIMRLFFLELYKDINNQRSKRLIHRYSVNLSIHYIKTEKKKKK